MLLEGKNALIYGGGGQIGGAVAKAFAREGATVHLAGRTAAKVEAVAEQIRAGGGRAEASEVDALEEAAVDAFVDGVATRAGHVDVSFNLISVADVQGTRLVEMPFEDFATPIEIAVRSTFLTVRAAARHMVPRGAGVFLAFGGSGDPVPGYSIGGFQVALHAVEAMRRQYASELGRHGIRFVTLKTGGILETMADHFPGREEIARGIVDATMLGRAATLEDVGEVAAFVASDQARSMTAATVNVSAGALIDD